MLTTAQERLRQQTAHLVWRARWHHAALHEGYFGLRPLVRWTGARCVDCGAPLDGYPEDVKLCLTHTPENNQR